MPEELAQQGLAQQLATSPQLGNRDRNRQMTAIKEIVQMLIEGMPPEELIANGVPEELVRAALKIISEQTTQVPPEQAGLANMMIGSAQ